MEEIRDKSEEFIWDVKELKKRNWKNVYKRGFKSYFILVVTVFIFSFIGTLSFLSSSSVGVVDHLLNVGMVDYDLVEDVADYIVALPIIKGLSPSAVQFIRKQALYFALNNKKTLTLLALNENYMDRNQGEVVVFLMIAMLFFTIGLFFIKKTLIVGHRRFYMERRFAENVKIRRSIAPFGNHNTPKILKTMFLYYLISGLWSLTVIGGIYKLFQYYCVPYIVAENPDVTWKEARDLSKAMTDGYKWKLFLMHLSCWYLYLIELIPFVSLFLSSPVVGNLQVEAYMKLRSRKDIDRSLLTEDAFDGPAYIDRIEAGEKPEDINVQFKMPDFAITGSSFDENDKYNFFDFTAMFFVFSFVGWLWEVMLHVYKDHVFVNRGYMYGPWLPIYGAGGAFIILLLSRFKKNKPKLFVMTMVLCGILEYLTSFVLDYFQNAEYWNYDKMFVNLNGRVCLAGLIAFALGGFLGVYILGPFIKRILTLLGKKKTIILCSVLIAAFVVDFVICMVHGPNTGKGVGHELGYVILQQLTNAV